jgi:hypothetical protein
MQKDKSRRRHLAPDAAERHGKKGECMKSFFLALARALEAAAVLCVTAAYMPLLFASAGARRLVGWPEDEVVLACLVLLGVSLCIRAVLGLRRAVPKFLGSALGFWRAVHPRRGLVGRWYHEGWCEPLASREQAREALAQHYGYRLPAEGYEILRIRPGLRGWRFGVWVTVQKRTRRARHWACCYVRWVSDPKELWLLRSSLRPQAAEPAQADFAPALAPIPLVGLESSDLDSLLGVRTDEGKPLAWLPLPSSAPA